MSKVRESIPEDCLKAVVDRASEDQHAVRRRAALSPVSCLIHSKRGEHMPAKPKPKETPELTKRQIDKFTQPGWAIDLVGKWDEATQSIVPFSKADRVRLGLDK